MVILPFSTRDRTQKYKSAMYFFRREYVRLPSAYNVEMLSRYDGTLRNPFLKPTSTIMLEQITAFFMASTAATSSASIVELQVKPLEAHLEANEALGGYNDIRKRLFTITEVVALVETFSDQVK